ncbi:hypothetical protein J4H86_22350 [Spiractinospora alimapuensis]|uniref:hypothetical protein n=1 Tax=Spiractinospora alimapuensis TaxID=2820884 RepID=UPI001F350BF4|nr:hypothetical protein [Spiractinospora alimapuensis]QVQ51507.1 hypothetical protein J4H86_22350 [Spiractinospora alimapuensis]
MAEFEITFRLDGISPDDHEAVGDLRTQFDADVSLSSGATLMTVNAPGQDACAAAVAFVVRAREAIGTIRFMHLDRDLVGVAEIALRTRVTAQEVTGWTGGTLREAPPFPTPEANVGDAPVWLWCEVNEWLEQIDRGDGRRRPNRYELSEIDALLPYVPATGHAAIHHRPRVALVELMLDPTRSTPN